MKTNETTDKIWKLLHTYWMNDYGAAAMMGNLYAESGMIPNRLEELCRKRLIEKTGKNWSDEEYTRAVDSGDISRDEFLHPLPGKQYGYGLAQWTSPGRKGELYDRCKKDGTSIGDLDTQVAFLYSELATNYIFVFQACQNAKSVNEASDIILTKFEAPKNAEKMKDTRAKYGQFFYDHYHEEHTMDMEKLFTTAEAELGYLEKKSNKDLDSKTENAGSNNYTKYGRDMRAACPELGDTFGVAYQWCQTFVDWCFLKAYGKGDAKKLLGGFTGYTPTGAGYFKNRGQYFARGAKQPKRGDVIYFHGTVDGTYRICHVGIVYKSDANTVYTIEGNTSDSADVIRNGGAVRKKSYALTNTRIDGYGRPNYSDPEPTPAPTRGNVSEYQKWLNDYYPSLVKMACGALLNVDNSYGNITRAASLCVWKHMANKYYGAKLTLGNNNFYTSCTKYAEYMTDAEIAKHPTLIVILQGILAGKGYYKGQVDGKLGTKTREAIHDFQKSAKIVPVGSMNADTWFKLFN